MKRRRVSRAFAYFAMCYTAIFLLFCTLLALLYTSASNLLKEDALHISRLELNSYGSRIDEMMSLAGTLSAQAAADTTLQRLINIADELDGSGAYDLWRAMQQLGSYSPHGSDFDGFYLYFPASGIVVTNKTAYLKAEFFFDHQYALGAQAHQAWREALANGYFANELLYMEGSGALGNTLSVINTVPYGYPSRHKRAVLIYYLSQKRAHDLMQGNYTQAGGGYCLRGADGEILMGDLDPALNEPLLALLDENPGVSAFQGTLGGRDVLISRRASTVNGTEYIIIAPLSMVTGRLDGLLRTMRAGAVAVGMVGLLFIFLFAWRNTRLIRGILRSLFPGAQTGASRDEFQAISGQINKLTSDNQNYQRLLYRQYMSLRSAFFFHWFSGEYATDWEVQEALSGIDLSIAGTGFLVAIIRNNQIGDGVLTGMNQASSRFSMLLMERLPPGVHLHALDEKLYALLFATDESDAEAVEQRARSQLQTLYAGLPSQMKVLIAMGCGCMGLAGVRESYLTANHALRQARANETGVVWYTGADTNGYIAYPMETEMLLINYIRAQNTEGLKRTLESIYRENIENRRLCEAQVRQLFYGLYNTCSRVQSEYGVALEQVERLEDMLLGAITPRRARTVFQVILDEYLGLAEALAATAEDRCSQIEQKVRHFIMANYATPSLSLGDIAAHVGLSEAYLSTFYKQRTGENVSVYLERLRIGKAYALLAETDQPVSSIAWAVGYYSDQTFRRAFKRVMGCTPSDVRAE